VNYAFKAAGTYKDNGFFAGGRRTVSESAAVPEPEAWAMLGTGFAVIGTAVRRLRAVVAATA